MQTNVFRSISVLGVLLNTQALAQASASDPEIDYCMSQQIAEGVEPLTENRLLVAEAVNAYLRKAQFTQEDAEQLCKFSNDSERIYITYMETRDMIRVGPLADDTSIQVAGTMVQLESCWFLLMDSGVFPLQLDPLPRTFMRVGQRVELTLSGPMVGCETECTYPIVHASDPRLSDWGVQPTELVMDFELDVRRTLEELGLEASVAMDATGVLVSGVNRDQVLLLEEALRGSFGYLRVSRDQDEIYFWPNARDSLNRKSTSGRGWN
jgi:hypothetical protein